MKSGSQSGSVKAQFVAGIVIPAAGIIDASYNMKLGLFE
jgi:hypothetical protein